MMFRNIQPGIVDNFTVDPGDPGAVLVTQMLWGHTTHIGCGWLQIDVGEDKWSSLPGRYENFFVCNYGVGGNVKGEPLYKHPDCQETMGKCYCCYLSRFFACLFSKFHDNSVTKLTECHNFSDSTSQQQPVTSLPVVKNKQQETVFSDFSVTTRAVIGSCLQAIQCLGSGSVEKRMDTSNCQNLFSVCHSEGPGAVDSRTISMTRHNVECRLENILCHVQVGREEDRTCQDKYDTCRDTEIGNDEDSGDKDANNFNSTMGKHEKLYVQKFVINDS